MTHSEYTKLVIFDCDGTLVDSQYMIVSTMQDVFSTMQLPTIQDKQIRAIIGLSLDEAVQQLQPTLVNEDIVNAVTLYKKLYFKKQQNMHDQFDPLYLGCKESLQKLSDLGYLHAVATGNSQRGMQAIIKQHDLHDCFVSVQTADFHPSKPHPSMIYKAIEDAGSHVKNTVMIGDTTYDMQMAKNAGVLAIGVTWGYHDESALKHAGADYIVQDYKELISVIHRFFTHG